MEKYITIRGKKVKEIPDNELQFLQLLVEFIADPYDHIFFVQENNRLINEFANRHLISCEEVRLYGFRKTKSVWKVLNIPHKEFLEIGEKWKKVSRDDLEDFRVKHYQFCKEIAIKYGLLPSDYL